MIQTYGQLAKRISQRMDSLHAAHNLAVLLAIPALQCHPLEGNRTGQWAISVSGNWRLIFDIDHTPISRRADNSIDALLVTAIEIIEITDYH